MRIYLLLAILGLMLVEGLLVPRTIRDFRIMQKMRHEAAPQEGLPVSIGPFAGYDKAGQPLKLVTDDTKWIVPVVLHSRQMTADLDYLSRLRKALPKPAIALVGVCDNSQCSDGQGPAQSIPELPILAFGSYAALKDIARFDEHNQVLLLNQFWGVRKSLPRAPSIPQMATEILEVTGQ